MTHDCVGTLPTSYLGKFFHAPKILILIYILFVHEQFYKIHKNLAVGTKSCYPFIVVISMELLF